LVTKKFSDNWTAASGGFCQVVRFAGSLVVAEDVAGRPEDIRLAELDGRPLRQSAMGRRAGVRVDPCRAPSSTLRVVDRVGSDLVSDRAAGLDDFPVFVEVEDYERDAGDHHA
jgi:hypothetical protein